MSSHRGLDTDLSYHRAELMTCVVEEKTDGSIRIQHYVIYAFGSFDTERELIKARGEDKGILLRTNGEEVQSGERIVVTMTDEGWKLEEIIPEFSAANGINLWPLGERSIGEILLQLLLRSVRWI